MMLAEPINLPAVFPDHLSEMLLLQFLSPYRGILLKICSAVPAKAMQIGSMVEPLPEKPNP